MEIMRNILSILVLVLVVSCGNNQITKKDSDNQYFHSISGEYKFDSFTIEGNLKNIKTDLSKMKNEVFYITENSEGIPVIITKEDFTYKPNWNGFNIGADIEAEYSLVDGFLQYTKRNWSTIKNQTSEEHNEELNLIKIIYKKASDRNDDLDKIFMVYYNRKASGR